MVVELRITTLKLRSKRFDLLGDFSNTDIALVSNKFNQSGLVASPTIFGNRGR